MRRSFRGGGGGGMGGGSGRGGGSMFRSVQRFVRAGGGTPPEPFSPSSNSTTVATADSRNAKQSSKPQSAPPNAALTLSAHALQNRNNHLGSNENGSPAFSTLINLPKPGASTLGEWGYSGDDDEEWECFDAGNDSERVIAFDDDSVFGAVPSIDEVNDAISALQQAFQPVSHALSATGKTTMVENEDDCTEGSEKINSSSSSEVDWIEPTLTLGNSRMLTPYGQDRVYDAFHLLQSEPSVQRLVVALSSDRAVWDAVLNNEVVKELRSSISQGDEQGGNNSKDKASYNDAKNRVEDALRWFLVNAKVKLVQLVDKIMELAYMFFQPANEEKKEGGGLDPLQEKLKTCLFLSIVTLLVVIVARAKSV